jgi:signal transduction histidine kinase
MTLRTRLAATMVLVLLAVVAVQFVLAERERRDLVDHLARISGEVDRSTAVFVQRAHELAAGGGPAQFDALLREIAPERARGVVNTGSTQMRVVVFTDSLHPRPVNPDLRHRNPGALALNVTQRSVVLRDSGRVRPRTHTERIFWMNRAGVVAVIDSFSSDSSLAVQPQPAASPLAAARSSVPDSTTNNDPRRDFVINLPLPTLDSDSSYSLQMRYSYASLAEELAHSRRRSLLWLAALLGMGTLAATAIAGQFTRPIRALEASFGRVVQGDLGVRLRPERNDEIGHLTESFNDMVARLGASHRMAERLAESEHLASLGQLAAGVAHEIRNPLNAILLNLQHMHDRLARALPAGAAPRDDLDKYHARIASEIERLESMVGSFLDLAKSAELNLESVDLAPGLRAAVELFRPVANEQGVRLTLDMHGDLRIVADPARMPTVWNNLLANAIQATPAGGSVTLRARRSDAQVDVVIEDTGAGIRPEVRARIWEPFYSGRENGTGLGLAIVRSTVQHHGGSVEVECPPEGGTHLHVRLPVEPTAAGGAARSPEVSA